MENETPKTKISKSYRFRREIVKAIADGMAKHEFDNETAYLEAVLELALGVELSKPVRPKVSRKALSLAA